MFDFQSKIKDNFGYDVVFIWRQGFGIKDRGGGLRWFLRSKHRERSFRFITHYLLFTAMIGYLFLNISSNGAGQKCKAGATLHIYRRKKE